MELTAQPFFITGFPRSRTLWFANYFSFGDSVCMHEASTWSCVNGDPFNIDTAILDATLIAAARYGAKFVGNSDAAMMLNWERIVDAYPDARWLLVDRNTDEVAASLERARIPLGSKVVDRMWPKFSEFAHSGIPRVVNFRDIDKNLVSIEEHLAPGMDFPVWRRRMLVEANVSATQNLIESYQRRAT